MERGGRALWNCAGFIAASSAFSSSTFCPLLRDLLRLVISWAAKAKKKKQNGTEREEACVVRDSRNRQVEPAPAPKTVDCASSRRLACLVSANMTCPDASSVNDDSSMRWRNA